jgi:hypothetical protein
MHDDQVQHRARNYPYERATHSFVYDCGDITHLPEDLDALIEGRHPVLAFGSNAAPEQLRRKYRDQTNARFAVTRATLQGYDVVYSAHLTSYGAVPATLAPSPGAVLETWTTWLDEDQLAHMHTTEMGAGGGADVNYAYGHLQELNLGVADVGMELASVGVYLSNYGALALTDAPLAFSRITTSNRKFEERDKVSVLEGVRDRLAPELDLDKFVHVVVGDKSQRACWGDALKAAAHPLDFPDFLSLVPGPE